MHEAGITNHANPVNSGNMGDSRDQESTGEPSCALEFGAFFHYTLAYQSR